VLEQLKISVEEVRQRRKDSALGLGRGGYNGRGGMKRKGKGGDEGDEEMVDRDSVMGSEAEQDKEKKREKSEEQGNREMGDADWAEEYMTLGLEQALQDAEMRDKDTGEGEGDVDMKMGD
jgi:hypothetical protein